MSASGAMVYGMEWKELVFRSFGLEEWISGVLVCSVEYVRVILVVIVVLVLL